jgi:D-3-phosphoglycerate dehydrogenase
MNSMIRRNTRFAIALTIRSFDTKGIAMRMLEKVGSVVFVNQTGGWLKSSALKKALAGADGVIAGTEAFTADVLAAAPGLKVISRVGVGTDSIDLNAAAARGIRVCTTPRAPVQAVAEHALALLLAAAKGVVAYDRSIHQGDFSVSPGMLLAGKRAGIIGVGRIGRRVGELLEAFGCQVHYYDPADPSGLSPSWTRCRTLPDLLRDADILTIHASPPSDGKPILMKKEFQTCKTGVILINTARGNLISEDDMVLALREGKIGAAGLDVFSSEPYRGPLLGFPQVIMTPHVASNTVESRTEMEVEAVQNLISVFRGMGV